MSELFVTLGRKDGHLVGLWSDVRQLEGEEQPRFALEERRLENARAVSAPARRAAEAWRGIGAGRLADAREIASALVVLLETVPLGDAGSGGSAGQWLCRRDAWAAVRSAALLQPRRVLRQLRASGYDDRVETALGARDPYVAYHHGAREEPGAHALPWRFRAYLLPLLRSRPWAEVGRALAAYWALDLHGDDALLGLAVRLLVHGSHGLAWLELMAREDPSRQDVLGRLVLDAAAPDTDPSRLPPETLDVLSAASGELYTDRLLHVLHGLRRGVDPEHLLEGLRIAAAFGWESRFTCGCHGRPLRRRHRARTGGNTSGLRELLAYFDRSFEIRWRGTLAIDAVEWNAADPARPALLARPSLRSWPALTSYRLLVALVYRGSAGWSDAERAATIEGALAGVAPRHQAKVVDALGRVLETIADRERLDVACALVTRMACDPFRARCDSDAIVSTLVTAAGPHAARLLQVPDRVLERVERMLCNDHDEQAQEGLLSLGRILPAFLLDALAAHPEPLLGAARELGLMDEARRVSVLKRFRAHPLMDRRFARRPLDRVCRTVEALVARGLPSPVPRKLREHREGRLVLSAASLEGHRQAIVRRLLSFRIQLLRRMVLEEAGRGVGIDLSREAERHAAQMLGSVHRNRRLLRRVLSVAPGDRRGFLDGHPANRAWLARHPRASTHAWGRGPVVEARLEDGRLLRLAFETDPAEVLRLGTHVGSCLAVGGACSSSAVAAMTDANKRVVFARDAQGRFVARQQVALTEDERLYCLPVYPLASGEEVASAFERFDLALAGAMGVDLERDANREVAVARLLASDFYDDGLWQRLAIWS